MAHTCTHDCCGGSVVKPHPGFALTGDPFIEGQSYFIRTVTYHCVGRVVSAETGDGAADFLVLEGASWIGDSGRFTQAIRDGVLNEVEPVGAMVVQTTAIVDAFPWIHALPMVQK